MPLESLSIVIPAYNEERRLGRTLRITLDYLRRRKLAYEIVVVDDGSIDRTVEVALEYATRGVRVLRNRVNHGKGYSVRRGVLSARHARVLFMDADLSTPIETLDQWAGEEGDVVIGSRFLRGSRIVLRQPWPRRVSGQVFRRLVSWLVLPGLHDSQCGFKLFTRKAAREVFARQTVRRFCFDVEVLAIARQQGLRIRELPVMWRNSDDTKVRLVHDSIGMFVDLLRIRGSGLKFEV